MSVDSAAVSDVNSEKDVKTVVSVVPWYNAAQFRKVYQCLYSNELEKKRWALDQISVWENKCHPSLPAAIDASYGITSAIVQDILLMNDATVNRHLDVQYIYSTAITRFVNLTVTTHEDQMQQGPSMTRLAKGLGIPSYIIDFRNEASHSVKPSLPCLRIAAEACMKYLKESYWESEAAQMKNHVKKPMDLMEIKLLICRYIKTKLRIIHNERKMPPQVDKQDELELKKCLKEIDGLIRSNKRLFIKVFVMDALFIPLDSDLKFIVSEETYRLFQEVYDENADDGVPTTPMGSFVMPDVPELHEILWKPVIYQLNRNDAVPLFLQALLKSVGDRTVVGQKLVIAWVMRILRIHSVNGRNEDSCLKSIFKWKGIVVNWRTLFYSSVVNPCIYSPFVFPLIICHLDLSSAAVQHFMQLVAIHLGQATDEKKRVRDKIFTLEQFLKIRGLQKAKRDKLNNLDDCIWSQVSVEDHKPWPIGTILNPVDDENEESPLEEDNFEIYDENDDYRERCILSNENDTEEDYCDMEVDNPIPDTFNDDVIKELTERENFLYRKK